MKQYLKTLETLKRKSKEYFEINNKLRELQGDFYTHAACCDCNLETSIVKLLDEIIAEECGEKELASYYLYECNPAGAFYPDDKTFVIEKIEDLEKIIKYLKG